MKRFNQKHEVAGPISPKSLKTYRNIVKRVEKRMAEGLEIHWNDKRMYASAKRSLAYYERKRGGSDEGEKL